jgi:hypothetical protein
LFLSPSLSLISQIKAKETRSESTEQEKKGKEKEKKGLASPRLLLGLRPASHLTSPPSAQASGKRERKQPSMAEEAINERGHNIQGLS